MTPAQAAALFHQVDIITDGRLNGIKASIATFKASPANHKWNIKIADFGKGEAEAITSFLMQLHKLNISPTLSFNNDHITSFVLDFTSTQSLECTEDPAKLLADYTAFLEDFKKSRQELAQRILKSARNLFPKYLRSTFPLSRLLTWDDNKRIFESPHQWITQILFKKLGINNNLQFYSNKNKSQFIRTVVLFTPFQPLPEFKESDSNAKPLSSKELEDIAYYIQLSIKKALPAIKANLFPTIIPDQHQKLHDQLAETIAQPLDFKSYIKIDVERFGKELAALNEAHYGKREDFTELVFADNTPIGLSEAKGERAEQEDCLSVSHGSVADFFKLTPYHQWYSLYRTLETLQQRYGQRSGMGSTIASVITRRIGNRVQFVTANAGDSYICYAVIDPITNTVKAVRRLNNLHTPDENINPEEKARVDNFSRKNKVSPSKNGRMGDGLAMSRCLGDSQSEPFGHSSHAEILFDEIEIEEHKEEREAGEHKHEIEVEKDDLVFAWVACDGLFEPSSITLELLAKIILQNYRTSSLDKIAFMFVDAAMNAKTTDNVSVALAQVKEEVISLSVFDGHGGYFLAHDAGNHFYPILKGLIAACLQAQNDPQKMVVPESYDLSLKSPVKNIAYPGVNQVWNLTLSMAAYPAFKDPKTLIEIQVEGNNVPHLLSCRTKTFEDALRLLNFLIHIGCKDSTNFIAYDAAKQEYSLILTRYDYCLMHDCLIRAKPSNNKKSSDLIHPSLTLAGSLFGSHRTYNPPSQQELDAQRIKLDRKGNG